MADANPMEKAIARARRAGIGVVLVLVATVVAWGTLVNLPAAVISAGVVMTDTPTHRIQHPDGGIVAEVAVSNGDRVEAGAVLIRLDDTEEQALRLKLSRDMVSARLEQARIHADLGGRAEMDVPTDLADAVESLDMAPQLHLEDARLQATRIDRLRQTIMLDARINGLRTLVVELEKKVAFEERSVAQARSLLDTYRGLKDQGRVRTIELEAIERRYLGLEASLSETRADLAQARHDIEAAEGDRDGIGAQDRLALMERMATLNRTIPEIAYNIAELDRRIARAEIRSPARGAAINVNYKALGAVIAPHDPILEIVPDADDFTLELRVNPTDIDRVSPGMRAQVMLSAFPQRLLPRIEAEVIRVSADAITAPENGTQHFLAWLKIDPESLSAAQAATEFDLRLQPGMPAEAFILTEENTLLGHIIEPFVRTFDRSFRDG